MPGNAGGGRGKPSPRNLSRSETLKKFKEGLRERGDGDVISEQELVQYVTTFEHFKHEGDALATSTRTWRRIVIGFIACCAVLCIAIFGLVIGSVELLKEYKPLDQSTLQSDSTFAQSDVADRTLMLTANADGDPSLVATGAAKRGMLLHDVLTLSGSPSQLQEVESLLLPRMGDPSTEGDHEMMQFSVAWIRSTADSLSFFSPDNTHLYMEFGRHYAELTVDGSTSFVPYDTVVDDDSDMETTDDDFFVSLMNAGSQTSSTSGSAALLQVDNEELYPDGGFDPEVCEFLVMDGGCDGAPEAIRNGDNVGSCALRNSTGQCLEVFR